MAVERDDGGPAFPQTLTPNGNPIGDEIADAGGLSIRDYFAAKAMAAIIACPHDVTIAGVKAVGEAVVSKTAYVFADAMLAARK